MNTIQEVKEYNGFTNKYLGKDIQKTLGLRNFQDLIASGRIERMNCRTKEGYLIYKLNQ